MENTKFTPGPWSHGIHFNGINFTTNPTVSTTKGKLIELDATNFSKYSTEEQEANAKLIASAPELLEALIEAEKHHQGMHSEMGWKIRNAIKKATGVEVNYQDSEYYK